MYIYNETNIPFTFEGGKEISLINKKTIQKDEKNFKSRQLHLLLHESITQDSNIKEKIAAAVNTPQPVKIVDKEICIYFSKKDCSPFITVKKSHQAEAPKILLVNLQLPRDGRVTLLENPNVFILGGHILDNQCVLALSFVKNSKPLVIEIFDRKDNDNRFIDYEIKVENDNIVVKKDVRKLYANIKYYPPKLRLKPYIPSKPTACIMCYGKDRNSLDKVISEDKKGIHHIVTINSNKTMEEEFIKLKQDNYGAATIFIDKSEFDEEAQKIYRKVITMAQKHLRIVILLFNNGNIKKIKY